MGNDTDVVRSIPVADGQGRCFTAGRFNADPDTATGYTDADPDTSSIADADSESDAESESELHAGDDNGRV